MSWACWKEVSGALHKAFRKELLPFGLAPRKDVCSDQIPKLQSCLSNDEDSQRCSNRGRIVIIFALHQCIVFLRRWCSSPYCWWGACQEVSMEGLVLLRAEGVTQRIAEYGVHLCFRRAGWRRRICVNLCHNKDCLVKSLVTMPHAVAVMHPVYGVSMQTTEVNRQTRRNAVGYSFLGET